MLTLLLGGGGFFVILLVIAIWAASNPSKAEQVAGWFSALVAKVYRRADRTAVAFKVQGDINSAREELLDSVPDGLIDKPVKIKWAGATEAETLLREGEVIVCMERADHHEQTSRTR